jgi:tetratricopeptide (TPR) repeat protein
MAMNVARKAATRSPGTPGGDWLWDCNVRGGSDDTAAAWAALVLVFNAQRNWGFALPPDQAASVDKRLYLAADAMAAANHAIELAPNDAFVRGLAARAAWMACQPDQVRIETRRAIALNPNDPQNLGPLGTLMAASGFWDEGVAIAEKGIALTAPSTPRWWWWAIGKDHWFRGRYQPALDAFRQAFVEQLWLSHLQMAIRCRSLTGLTKPRHT